VGIWNACRPIIMILFAHELFAIDGSSIATAAIGIGSGITWIVQHAHRRRRRQWPKNRLAVVQA